MKVTVRTQMGGPGRPAGTLNNAMRIRIEKVARMRVNGVSDSTIQRLLDLAPPAFRYLINLDEYKEVEDEILLGHLTEIDKATAGQIGVLHQQLREAVPAALRCVVEVANQRRDLRTALNAATELLDRDPDRIFSKSSARTEEIEVKGFRLPDGVIDATTAAGDDVIAHLKKDRVM